MEVIKVKEMGFNPGIVLDKENGIFEITGKACPENAASFYKPLLEWIDEYAENPNEETVFEFKLSYYNTATSKILLSLMQKLERMHKLGNKVVIKWYYYEDDEEMEASGEDFAEMIDVPFEMIVLEE